MLEAAMPASGGVIHAGCGWLSAAACPACPHHGCQLQQARIFARGEVCKLDYAAHKPPKARLCGLVIADITVVSPVWRPAHTGNKVVMKIWQRQDRIATVERTMTVAVALTMFCHADSLVPS